MNEYLNYIKHYNDNSLYASSILCKAGKLDEHWHTYYELEFVCSGEGTININGKDFVFSEGTLHFVTPTDFHSYSFHKDTIIKKISFNDFVLNSHSVASKVLVSGFKLMQTSSQQFEWLNTILDKLIYEYALNSSYKQEYMIHTINLIFTEFAQKNKINIFENKDINTPIHYICTHFREDLTLEFVANITGLSPNYFCSKFKKTTGLTFKQFLTEQRLSYAVKLLVNTDLSITEIAMTSGFNSVSYFLKVFLNKYKISPKAYRQNLLKKDSDGSEN